MGKLVSPTKGIHALKPVSGQCPISHLMEEGTTMVTRAFSTFDCAVLTALYDVEQDPNRGTVLHKQFGSEKVIDVCANPKDAKFVSDEFAAGRRVVADC